MTSRIILERSFWIVSIILLAACGTFPPEQTVKPTLTNVPVLTSITQTPTVFPTENSLVPSQMPTFTQGLTPTQEPEPLPACTIVDQDGKLDVLSDESLFVLGPSKKELDQALASNFPKWADFRQEVSWDTKRVTAGVVVAEASFQERFALNPAVTLVTVGVNLDWKLPTDGNLYWPSRSTGERLVHLWFEYSAPEHAALRADNPEVANAATYALYVFFDRDQAKLLVWCNTYQKLFKTSPLKY